MLSLISGFALASVLRGAPPPLSLDKPPIRLAMVCEFIEERISGKEKQCVYDCGGSEHITLVGVNEMCRPRLTR